MATNEVKLRMIYSIPTINDYNGIQLPMATITFPIKLDKFTLNKRTSFMGYCIWLARDAHTKWFMIVCILASNYTHSTAERVQWIFESCLVNKRFFLFIASSVVFFIGFVMEICFLLLSLEVQRDKSYTWIQSSPISSAWMANILTASLIHKSEGSRLKALATSI